MPNSNFARMMQLIDETFSTREDPDQLQVDEKVIARLNELHPASLSEYNEGNGPAVWVLLIPTVTELMEKFISDEISEQRLFDATKPGMKFDCIYLCSATVLPEYRRKGLAKKMTVEAIEKIREDFEIRTLFVWPFSEGGIELAKRIAEEVGLELKIKS
jgi:GNAT superfamily N-acetyltransferase